MIKSFACKATEKLFIDKRVQLIVLNAAQSLNALMLNPGNMFHALKGNRQGQYAISINKQWRVCFEWHDGNAFNVTIVGYH